MTPKERVVTFRPDDDILDAMSELRDRDGMAFGEQIRRALRPFLMQKGVMKQAAPRRAATRRKA
jgi:hypothetical protein